MLRVVGIGFDHMHVGDQLRLAGTHPAVQVVGVVDGDPERMARVSHEVGLGQVPRASAGEAASALDSWKPDLAIVCSTTAEHRGWVEALAERGVAVVLEKPFATGLDDAEAMIAVAAHHRVALAVNWPLAWVPSHRTARRLIVDGAIGTVIEVHYYGGNRGPLRHGHGKVELDGRSGRDTAWWYRRSAGGGSLRDYLGYGATLGTWFRSGEAPSSVTAVTHVPDGLEVDEQSVVIASYASGLSTFHTRWGTFTDPWTHQTQPRCGFVVIGTEGTLASPDYADAVVLQDTRHPDGTPVPVDELPAHESDSIAAMVHHLDSGDPLDGPMTVEVNRTGQAIIDAAVRSAGSGHRVDMTGAAERSS